MPNVYDSVTKQTYQSVHCIPDLVGNYRYAIMPIFPEGVPQKHLKVIEGTVEFKGETFATGVITEMTQAEKDVADAQELVEAKKVRMEVIDVKTRELIGRGFVYDGHRFSLSEQAQMNIVGLKMAIDAGAVTWPHKMSTMDDNAPEYALTDQQAYMNIYFTAMGTIKTHMDSGRFLKVLVATAPTLGALNDVIDTR